MKIVFLAMLKVYNICFSMRYTDKYFLHVDAFCNRYPMIPIIILYLFKYSIKG